MVNPFSASQVVPVKGTLLYFDPKDALLDLNTAKVCDLNLHQEVMALYDQLHPTLLAHLRVLGLTNEDAEDTIHESFLRLVQHRMKGLSDENVRGWLFRVAYNLAMDVHRSRKHYRYASNDEQAEVFLEMYEVVDPSPSPEAVLMEKETLRNLRSAVLKLTSQQRKCLVLRSRGLRYREIASTLGISVQRAARLLQRGTARIAETL